MAMILLPVLNIGGMQMLQERRLRRRSAGPRPTPGTVARSIGAAYLALTLTCALGYVWAGMSGFEGQVHAISTDRDRRHRQPQGSFASVAAPRAVNPNNPPGVIGFISVRRFGLLSPRRSILLWRRGGIRR